MSKAEKAWIVGGLSNELPPAVEGSRDLECEQCGKLARFSPASLTRPEAAHANFVCLPCAQEAQAKAGKPIQIGEMSAAQRAELHAAGLTDEMIAAVEAGLREKGISPEAIELLAAMKCPATDEDGNICAIPGNGPGRPTDAELTELQQILFASVSAGMKGPSPLPPEAILTLCNEIAERRAVMRGATQALLEASPTRETGLHTRPTDTDLRRMCDYWRKIVDAGGPSFRISIEALALVTLAEELIESRKAPRA